MNKVQTSKFKAGLLAALILLSPSALAQTVSPGMPVFPMGNCQLTASQLASAIGLASCTRASFTASAGSSSNLLVVTAVTGVIRVGDTLLTGTGITAGGTIVNQVSGTPGGAGTYTISNTNTTSAAAVTTGGIPTDAQGHLPTMVVLFNEVVATAVRWRDDGGAPTSAIGMEVTATTTYTYLGTMTAIQFIAGTGSPILDAAFYRTSSP